MALFSRRHRSQDPDNVRLASPDHAWWNGDEPDDPTSPDPGSTGVVVDRWVGAARSDHDGGTAVGEAQRDEADHVAVEPANRLERDEATEEASAADAVAGPFGRPAEVSGRFEADPDLDDHERGIEGDLFVVDGLPDQDRMVELVGALGLEPDADWVDIARAHRRLATVPPNGGDWDDERQRRSANEAYACLRLFHH